MRVVLDTNVLINGFKDEYSYEKKIIDAVIAGDIESFANRQTLQKINL
jgi:predicted nucleic acid-binding protein